MDINNGSLSFTATMDTSQLNDAINETIKRVQGLSSETAKGGENMAATFSKAVGDIKQAIADSNAAFNSHEQAIAKLKQEFTQLGQDAAKAFDNGDTVKGTAYEQRQRQIQGEIQVRRQLQKEIRDNITVLQQEQKRINEEANAAQDSANKHQSLRGRIRELREEMAAYSMQFGDQTEQYRKMADELGNLQDMQGDIQTQGKILSNDEAKFQGVISGLQGVVGGFTAASSAVSLFTGENEDLQKAMLKVQQLMSITMGLQQVSQALNKDSAFRLVTINSLKQWWTKITQAANVAQSEETALKQADAATTAKTVASTTAQAVAKQSQTTAVIANTGSTVANTTAQAANTAGAVAGATANFTLAGAFRAVGAAIASIPVFGWIAAAITAIVGVLVHFSNKAAEAKKRMEEFYKSVAENAYKPIGTMTQLRTKWNQLGDSIKAKEKFIKDNAKLFKELGLSVKSVYDAENLLTRNADLFIQAQIKKAKATALIASASDKVTKALTLQQEIDAMPTKIKTVSYSGLGNREEKTVDNTKRQKKVEELEKLNTEIEGIYKRAAEQEQQGAILLRNAGVSLTDSVDSTNTDLKDKAKTYAEQLQAIKKQYDDFDKMNNSGDSSVVNAARKAFENLLKQGESYIAYLQNQRKEILKIDETDRTKAQTEKLNAINLEIASETEATQTKMFEEQIKKDLELANTVIEKLDVIRKYKNETQGGNTKVDESKRTIVANVEKDVTKQAAEQTQKLLQTYQQYTQKRLEIENQYNNDIALLQRAKLSAATEAEKKAIDDAMKLRQKAYEKESQSSGNVEYDALLENYRSYEQQKQKIREDFASKIQTATEMNDAEMVARLQAEQAKQLLDIDFSQLKASPEFAEAFTDVGNVATETLQNLLARFEECKIAAGEALNPEDLLAYGSTLNSILNELIARDPFSSLIEGYKELATVEKELKIEEEKLKQMQADGASATAIQKQIAVVNKKKTESIKVNNKVRKSENEVTTSVGKLCDELEGIGSTIGGQAGQIISLIGEIGNFGLMTMSAVKATSKTTSEAIKACERASVILAIIGAALSIATKIFSFLGDGGRKEYEKAKKVYDAYIDTIDELIAKQKELMEAFASPEAKQAYEYSINAMKQSGEAARQAGKQYLNTGAWVFGHSNGIKQYGNISQAAWNQARKAAKEYGIALDESRSRMTWLFDLSVEQLRILKEQAPLFYASLDEDVRNYIDRIIESEESLADLKKAYQESLTGVDFDSFENDFVDMLMDCESSTADFAKSFQEYMRKAMIMQMYKSQFQKQIQQYYDMWSNAMDANSAGGSDITEAEQSALNTLRDSIVNGATSAAEKINEQFGVAADEDSLTGAVSSVSEETASLIAGQMNAIRINQVEAADTLRQQLLRLDSIVANTQYCRELQRLESIASNIEKIASNNLRANGL